MFSFGWPPFVLALGLRALAELEAVRRSTAARVVVWGATKLVDLTLLGFAVTFMERFYPGWLFIPPSWLGGKNSDTGRMRFPWPYLIYEEFAWSKFIERISSGPKKMLDRFNLIHSGDDKAGRVYLGTWPAKGDEHLPENVSMVLDMTNEVPAHKTVHEKGRRFLNAPVWDQQLPVDVESWIAKVHEAAKHPGDLYVHCLMGVGRSSMAVACILIARGLAASAREAYEMIRKQRPVVHWNEAQMNFVEKVAPRFIPGQV